MSKERTPWIVAIGASGPQGLRDIQELLRALPTDLAAVVMVVLHRKWDQISALRTVLARGSPLPVVVAAQHQHFQSGRVYIGEPSHHLTLTANSFGEIIYDPEREHGGRTVDLLFNSVAAHAGARMIGVVLSGSLDDGSRGLAAIHDAGGVTMVLRPSAAAGRGMPENAINYDGLIDLIGDPTCIADGIRALVGRGLKRTRRQRSRDGADRSARCSARRFRKLMRLMSC